MIFVVDGDDDLLMWYGRYESKLTVKTFIIAIAIAIAEKQIHRRMQRDPRSRKVARGYLSIKHRFDLNGRTVHSTSNFERKAVMEYP